MGTVEATVGTDATTTFDVETTTMTETTTNIDTIATPTDTITVIKDTSAAAGAELEATAATGSTQNTRRAKILAQPPSW